MRKIITLLTTFALLGNTYGFAQNEDATQYNEEAYVRAEATVEFLADDDLFSDPTKPLTREMFARALYEIYSPILGTSNNTNPYFTDVAENDKEFVSVQTLCESGVISEAEAFNPDAVITYNEAVKMVTLAGGYANLAETYGGYPNGHMLVAQEISLSEDIENPSNLVCADGAIILFNSLFAPILVNDGTEMYYKDAEKNQLSRMYGLCACEGVITQTEYNSYILNAGVTKGVVTINGETFATEVEISPDMLGKQVFAICDKDTKTAKVIVETENEEFTITGADFKNIQNGRLIYKENGKERHKGLDDLYIVIYNGRRIANLTTALVSEPGTTITLLNNDDDDEYELIKVEASVSGTVDSVDYDYTRIDISLPERKTFNFDPDNSYLKIYDAEGKEITLVEIAKDSVVEIQSSQDGLVAEIRVMSSVVSGKYSERDTSKHLIRIGDVEYKVSSAFAAKYLDSGNIPMGKTIEVYVNRNGVVVALASDTESFVYGYLQDCIPDNSHGEDELYIKLFTTSGTRETYTASEKIRIDGARTTLSGAYTTLTSLTDKFVRYLLNKDNEIVSVDISCTYDDYVSANPTYKFGDTRPEENSLLLYKNMESGTNAQLRTAFNGFAGYATLSGTPIFFIPNDDTDEDKYDDWRVYSVSDLPGNTSFDWKAYDIKPDGTAGAVVIRYSDLSVFDRQYGSFICESISEAIMSDGDIGKALTGYDGSEYKTYYIPKTVEDKFKVEYGSLETEGFSVGDIYRIGLSGGKVVDVKIDFEYLTTNKYTYKGLNGTSDTYFVNDLTSGYGLHTTGGNTYLEGNVYSINGDYAFIGMTKDPDATSSETYHYGNMRLVKIPAKAVVYNREFGFVRPIDREQISTYIGAGDNAAHVIMRFNDTRPQFMVVVE